MVRTAKVCVRTTRDHKSEVENTGISIADTVVIRSDTTSTSRNDRSGEKGI